MSNRSSGYGIQVIKPTEEHFFTLDEQALTELLSKDDIKDRAVVVVSVAGAYRKGKSFILDFFLRYLHYTYDLGKSDGKWMGSEEEPLEGFSWRGGSERHTTGLLLWSQPFKATLANGEKVVILLMDTQGTFDSESTVKDNATVFALSTMVSSVQIYNVSQNIEEDDLQHLELFTDYGSLALKSISGKPFQRLQFLVRDWSCPYEYSYGAEGGEKFLVKRLEVHKGQHKELQTIRQYIAGCFEQLSCFLMPHPGMTVATNPNFNGRLSDISPEFKSSLNELMSTLLAPESLVLKRIGGQIIRAKDLLLYFKAYMNIFNGTELPEPRSILDATAEANNLSAMAEGYELYDTLMEEICGGNKPYLEPTRLKDEHHRIKDKVLLAFQSKKKMGGKALSEKYATELIQELDEKFIQLSQMNEKKNIFNLAATPLVMSAVAALGYLLSIVGAALGVKALMVFSQILIAASLAAIAVWGYNRTTGNAAGLVDQVDNYAQVIRTNVLQFFNNSRHSVQPTASENTHSA